MGGNRQDEVAAGANVLVLVIKPAISVNELAVRDELSSYCFKNSTDALDLEGMGT